MSIFIEGRTTMFLFMIVVIAVNIYLSEITKKGRRWDLRKLPAVEAISEGIGRAVELGKAVHFAMGNDRAGPGDPDRSHSYPVLKYVAIECAKRDCRLITTVGKADVHPVLDQIVREASIEAGKPEWYRMEDVRFLGEDQYIYAAGVAGILARENVGTNFNFGYQRGNLIMLLEAGKMAGCFQIGGQARYNDELGNLPLACDYSLMLEEMIAAGAYLSGDPAQIGTIVAQDVIKAILIGLTAIGTLLFTANIDFIYKIVTL